jgi:hypothetical protein
MLDRDLGLEREVVGYEDTGSRYDGCIRSTTGLESNSISQCINNRKIAITNPASPEAAQWEGWFYGRQSLKPCMEPIAMAQKPPEGRMVDYSCFWKFRRALAPSFAAGRQ